MWLGIEAELEWMVRIGERGLQERVYILGSGGLDGFV